jgi:hypothetical protein
MYKNTAITKKCKSRSVLVTIVIGFYQYLTPYDVRQATINLVKAVQEQPPSRWRPRLF